MLRILVGLDTPDKGKLCIESRTPTRCVYMCSTMYPFDLGWNGIDSFHEPIRKTLSKIVKKELSMLGRQTGMWDSEEMVSSILFRTELGHLPLDARGNALSGSEVIRFSCAIAIAECCSSLVPPVLMLDDMHDRADPRYACMFTDFLEMNVCVKRKRHI